MTKHFYSLSLLAGMLMAPSVASQQNQPAQSSGTSLAQTLGPWELTPPTSATLISGGGASFGWLNTANAPLSLADALTSLPIESGAYANADAGTTVEVTFAGGVVNGAGADLVMLDAQFDLGDYTISSDWDGFTSSVAVSSALGIYAATGTYFYELNLGPWPADVVGLEVDLSSIGVPNGFSVNSLRFTCQNSACDPVSLAKIDSAFSLSVSALTAGSLGTFDVSNGTPFDTIGIGLSLAGNTPTFLDTGVCGFLVVDLVPPIIVLTTAPGDTNGAMSFSMPIPSNASGVTVHFQALDFGSCELSNGVTTTVL